jgi:hypothetical protein
MHRGGLLRYRVFERTNYCCEVCDDLTAQWKETKYPQVTVAAEVSASEKLLLLATGTSHHAVWTRMEVNADVLGLVDITLSMQLRRGAVGGPHVQSHLSHCLLVYYGSVVKKC